MQQYFINNHSTTMEQLEIRGEDHHHITRVMRMKEGDEIICVTNDERAFVCKIKTITLEKIELEAGEQVLLERELPIEVTIVSGIPKGDKLELVVQKGTELGARRFIPFQASRSISKWDKKKADKRRERLYKIAKEAAEQSSRLRIPTISSQVSLKELIELSEMYDKKIIAYEEAAQGSHDALTTVFQQMKRGESLLALFGPEGGLSAEEVEVLKENNFEVCSLGPRILRTETAPFYLLSAASYHFELLK